MNYKKLRKGAVDGLEMRSKYRLGDFRYYAVIMLVGISVLAVGFAELGWEILVYVYLGVVIGAVNAERMTFGKYMNGMDNCDKMIIDMCDKELDASN